MKLSDNYLLLFDEECALCAWSAKIATVTGIIGTGNRTPYQKFSFTSCPIVDRQKAANEIALINKKTGEVTYGLKSLFEVLCIMMPTLRPILSFKPLIWFVSKLYKLFALNRRVIFTPASFTGVQPSFSLIYRMIYIFLTWFVTSLILTSYVSLMVPLVPVGSAYREYLICGGQIIFQGVIITVIADNKCWDYLGNMMTISFGGAIVLLPVILFSPANSSHPAWYTMYFMMVAGAMLLEHIRRTKILGLGWLLSITWALYRAIILIIILLS